MALIKNNDLTDGMSGRIGNKIVFRVVKGRTVATRRPIQTTSVITDKQRAHRERFKRATTYAKAALLDVATKAAYALQAKEKDFMNAFTAAVTDFMKSPKVDSIDNAAYSGKVGESIILKVSDDFKVADVKVTITLPTSVVVETGAATLVAGTADWKYVTTKANATLAGSKIKVVVTDKPGNTTTFEKTL
jgi:hypothetical protein